MANTAFVAYLFAGGLLLFGGCTVWFQLRGITALRSRTHVPSDELGYLRGRHRRRLITGVLLALIGALIAGAFLSGLEPQIDALTPPPAGDDAQPRPADQPREMTPDQKQLVRVWVGYWVVVLVLVFAVLVFALADALATRRYAFQQYRILKEDHEAKLRRDLAVYKAQHGGRGGRGGSAQDPDA